MPKVKIPKDSELYFELKALYETGNFTNDELGVKFDINEKHVRRFAKEGKWERGKEKEYFDAKKLVSATKVIDEFKPAKEKNAREMLDKQAEKAGLEFAKNKMHGETLREMLDAKVKELAITIIDQALQHTAQGGNKEQIEEDFYYGEAGLEHKSTIKTLSSFDVLKKLGITGNDLLKGLGVLQPTPTVAIQNNNTNNQGGEVKPQHITAVVNQAFAIEEEKQ